MNVCAFLELASVCSSSVAAPSVSYYRSIWSGRKYYFLAIIAKSLGTHGPSGTEDLSLNYGCSTPLQVFNGLHTVSIVPTGFIHQALETFSGLDAIDHSPL